METLIFPTGCIIVSICYVSLVTTVDFKVIVTLTTRSTLLVSPSPTFRNLKHVCLPTFPVLMKTRISNFGSLLKDTC